MTVVRMLFVRNGSRVIGSRYHFSNKIHGWMAYGVLKRLFPGHDCQGRRFQVMISLTGASSRAGVACILWMCLTGPAWAHGLGAEARLLDGKVVIQVFFDDDTAAQGAKVSVRDLDGRSVWEGQTDSEGKATFNSPPPGQYRAAIDAGAGHRTAIRFTIPGQSSEPDLSDGSHSEGQVVSEGKTREEFTKWPWLRLAIGLAIIALGFLVLPRLVKTLATGKGSTPSPG